MTKVAAVQMNSQNNVEENLKSAALLIEKAAEEGAELVVLPENFALMGANEEEKLAIKEQEGKGPIQEFLKNQAKQRGIYVVGGTIPIESEYPDKVYATCFVYNDRGRQIARYDKIHLFDVHVGEQMYQESKSIIPGTKIVVVPTPFGTLGLSVCYDLRFPELYRRLLQHGANILIIPAAFTKETGQAHWEVLLRARAIENLSYVVAAAQVGSHPAERETFGDSIVVSPWGEVLNHKERHVGVVVSEVDLNMLFVIRKRFPALEHQKMY